MAFLGRGLATAAGLGIRVIGLGTPPAPEVRHPLALHMRNLWSGTSISLFGDQFYLVALPWLVLQLTGSGVALCTVLMTTAVPRAVLMLAGGAVTLLERYGECWGAAPALRVLELLSQYSLPE